MNPNLPRRRSFRAAVFVLGLGLALASAPAGAAKPRHASPIGSTPAADARLTSAPKTIRLVAQAGLDSALFPPLVPEVAPATRPDSSTVFAAGAVDQKPVPIAAALLRGLGLGAIMAGVGLLFFGSAARNRRNLNPDSIVGRFLGFGAVLLAAHMGAWLYHLSPGTGMSGAYGFSALKSTPGMVESARVLLAFLAFWAIARGRRGLALFLGLACLAVSGALGHTAAIYPAWTVPAKSIHLIGAAIWIGGLIWIGWTFRRDITAFRIEARRVSSVALIALIAVTASGVIQTLTFLDWREIFESPYGRLVVAKITGLLILVLLGGYNRVKLVPNLDDSRKGRKLSRSVSQELVVMFLIILVSGFLAYFPVPELPVTAKTSSALS